MRGEKRNAPRRKPEPKVIDLMDALRASVDDAKKSAAKGKKRTKARSKRSAA
jgi:non-homologous end joining protein Ku